MIRLTEIPDLQATQVGAPQVNPSVAMAAGNSLGSVAQGIAQVGEAFADEAQRIQSLENARLESAARQQWMGGWGQLQAELENDPDPTSHLKRTEDFLQQQKGTLEQPDMSEAARENLRLQFDDFATRAKNAATGGAARLANQRAGLTLSNEFDSAIQSGNTAAYERAKATALQAGILLPEQADKMDRDFTETLGKRERQRQALEEPDIFLDTTTDTAPEGVDPVEWANLRSTAKRSLAQDTAATSADINDGIATGNITRPEQIDELAPNLRPAAREALKAELLTRADASARAQRSTPAYQAATVAKVSEMLSTYDVEADGYDTAFVEMDTMVRSLPPGAVRDELGRQLDRSRTGQYAAMETTADFQRAALDDLHKAGAFGSGTRRQPIAELLPALGDRAALLRRGFTEEQAEQIASAPTAPERITAFREASKQRAGMDQSTVAERAFFDTVQSGDEGYFEIPDLAGREKQRRAYGLAKTKLEEWIKRNPQATEEQSREALARITGETAIPGMVEQILSRPPEFDGSVLPPKPDQ